MALEWLPATTKMSRLMMTRLIITSRHGNNYHITSIRAWLWTDYLQWRKWWRLMMMSRHGSIYHITSIRAWLWNDYLQQGKWLDLWWRQDMVTITTFLASGHGSGMITSNNENSINLRLRQDMVTTSTFLASGHGCGMISCNNENVSTYDDVKTW